MPTDVSGTAKRAPRRSALVEQIRGRIVRGEFAPGSRLPSHVDLVQDLGACKRTIEDALSALKRDGFIESRPSSGTFVAENPPHLSRYAFVFGPDPTGAWQAFAASLRREIASIEKNCSCQFAFYENVTPRPDTFEYQGLLRDIRDHRVAGLLLRDNFGDIDLSDTPFCTTEGIPRVVLTSDLSQAPGYRGITAICQDEPAFFERALGYLRERGRSRIATLVNFEPKPREIADIIGRVEQSGMTAKRCWIQHVSSFNQALGVTELLLSLPANDRPDGILLVNEFLIEPVGTGILASGVQAGRDLDVVAYCNMPCMGSPLVPIRRLGVDTRQRLRTALDLLDRQRRGEPVPQHVFLPFVFEEEVSLTVDRT